LRLRLSSNSAAKDSPTGDSEDCGETLAINEKTFSNRRLGPRGLSWKPGSA
jgi:hypothetical protein